MNKFEQIILFTFIISGILSFCLMPMSNLVFAASASTLAILYLTLNVLFFSNKSIKQILSIEVMTSAKKDILNRITGYALAINVVGILFYVLPWPGEKMMLLFGWISLAVLSLVIFKKHSKNPLKEHSSTLQRTLVFLFLALILWTIPVDSYLELKYRSYQAYFEALKNVKKDTSNKVYQEILQQERQLMYFSK